MREPRWVPRLVIDSAHLDQLREHGGLPGVRDENALESALARAQQRTYDPSADLALLAAAYGYGIATNYPFNDGNKRTALLGMAVFLELNDHELDASEAEVVVVVLAMASGQMKEPALAAWLRRHVARAT